MRNPAILAGSLYLPKETVNVASIKSDLTVSYMPMGAEEALEVELFKEDAKYIAVPRQYGLKICKRLQLAYTDKTSIGFDANFPKVPEPRDYQIGPLDELVDATSSYYDFIFRARTGWGKCQKKGTPVIMFDGSVKRVEHVKVGDLLMGPDSRPRRVLSLARGVEEMFEVVPKKGETYTFNRAHILSLKCTASYGGWEKGQIVNVEIGEYLQWPKKQKHLFKLWRTGVEFPEKNLPYDPYFVGLYLGDGAKANGIRLTIGNNRPEVQDYVRGVARTLGIQLREYEERSACRTFSFATGKSDMQDFFMGSLVDASSRRFIPKEYLTGSREQRLQLLAGILDTDGYLYSNVYDLVCKDRTFADQVVFLARSLGLAAHLSPCEKKAQGWALPRPYFRVKISGDTSIVPCITPRRQATPRRQKKDALVSGFELRSVGDGEFYGFTLDQDSLYLLGDFTVTHNTVGGLIAAARIGRTTLVIVDQTKLRNQWIDALKKFFGLDDSNIGVVQGDAFKFAGCPVVIAMVQTLVRRQYPKEFYDYFGTVIVDEVHTIGAPTFGKVLFQFPAAYRFGVSATPSRRDGLQKTLDHHLGKVRVYVDDEHEESAVYVAEHDSVYSWYANKDPKIGRFINEIAEDASRSLLSAQSAVYLYETGRDVLVLSDRIEHLNELMSLCYYLGVPEDEMGLYAGYRPEYAYVKDPKPLRKPEGHERGTEYTPVKLQTVAKRLNRKTLDDIERRASIIFGTYGMFSKGVDIPRLTGGVDATPRSQAEQVHGRILRGKMPKKPIWITIVDVNSYRSVYALASRIAGYLKNNATISRWSIEEGKTPCDPADLRAKCFEEVDKMKSMQIVQNSDGRNTLQKKETRIDRARRLVSDIKSRPAAPRKDSPTASSRRARSAK